MHAYPLFMTVQVWIDNVAVLHSSAISAAPTATFSFPLANALYDIFVAFERCFYSVCNASTLRLTLHLALPLPILDSS